jgi:hypothetical protein
MCRKCLEYLKKQCCSATLVKINVGSTTAKRPDRQNGVGRFGLTTVVSAAQPCHCTVDQAYFFPKFVMARSRKVDYLELG